jgi:hypothetical protein
MLANGKVRTAGSILGMGGGGDKKELGGRVN